MAVARISREDWRSAAGRLVLFAMLVFGVTAHAVGLSISLHRFESGTPVRPTTYVARFTEIAAAEGRSFRSVLNPIAHLEFGHVGVNLALGLVVAAIGTFAPMYLPVVALIPAIGAAARRTVRGPGLRIVVSETSTSAKPVARAA